MYQTENYPQWNKELKVLNFDRLQHPIEKNVSKIYNKIIQKQNIFDEYSILVNLKIPFSDHDSGGGNLFAIYDTTSNVSINIVLCNIKKYLFV